MFYHYFLINQLPLINDIAKYINILVVKNTEYPLIINEKFSNHNLIHYDDFYNQIIEHEFNITFYIKNGKIVDLKVYNSKHHGVLNLQKSYIKDIFIRKTIKVKTIRQGKCKKLKINSIDIENGWYMSYKPVTFYYTLL
jgi:hypothetical protein